MITLTGDEASCLSFFAQLNNNNTLHFLNEETKSLLVKNMSFKAQQIANIILNRIKLETCPQDIQSVTSALMNWAKRLQQSSRLL